MGLDMYAFTVDADVAGDNVVDLNLRGGTDNEVETTELFYWRKFNALHGWMEQLYREKGGTAVIFNCNTVRLTNSDLSMLEYDASKDNLRPVNGCFFGAQEIYDYQMESIDEFVAKARAALAEGKAVYYDSWW